MSRKSRSAFFTGNPYLQTRQRIRASKPTTSISSVEILSSVNSCSPCTSFGFSRTSVLRSSSVSSSLIPTPLAGTVPIASARLASSTALDADHTSVWWSPAETFFLTPNRPYEPYVMRKLASAGDSRRGVKRSVQIGSELIRPGILLCFPFSIASIPMRATLWPSMRASL